MSNRKGPPPVDGCQDLRGDHNGFKAGYTEDVRQIAVAPEAAREFKATYFEQQLPERKGYKQLAIIFGNQGRFQDAIELSQQAEFQGWTGDWVRRVERCEKKLRKAQQDKM